MQCNQDLVKQNKWILEFETKDPTKNPLMGWESSSDTYDELKLEFSSKELAINYAKKKKIDFELIEPKKRKIIKKSYSDNFLLNKCLNFLLKKNGFYGA